MKQSPANRFVCLAVAICLGIATALAWFLRGEPTKSDLLRISLVRSGTPSDSLGGTASKRENVVPDTLSRKFDPLQRADFRLVTREDAAISMRASGVQVDTPSGWKTTAEEYRSEVWRLKSGIPREVCVERPLATRWRAYVRYGTEMKGAALLKAQLREAWKIKSFSNWAGKAWGGGRYSGSYELFSEVVQE